MSDALFLALQAYGDNVIALRLLQALRGRASVRVLGTRLTREVAGVLGFDAFPVTCLPQGNAAFYDLKAAGPWRALRDFIRVRRAIRSMAGPGTVVLLDNQRKSRTNALLARPFRHEQPHQGRSAYEDRSAMLERVLGVRIVLPDASPPRRCARVLVAPEAREAFRAFPAEALRNVLTYFAARGSRTCLLDPAGRYGWAHNLAGRHLTGCALAQSAAELRSSDLVLAPDSLFLHLAYALGVPALALVPAEIARAFYFAPPGMAEHAQFLAFDVARDAQALAAALDARLTGT